MCAVVDHELSALDPAGKPFLVRKLIDAMSDELAASNAHNFILAMTSKCDPGDRTILVKMLVEPKASLPDYAEFISMMVACDPHILTLLDPATKLRVRQLLIANVDAVGVKQPFIHLRQPAHVLGNCIEILGEDFMLHEMHEFTETVVKKAPYFPEFIAKLSKAPTVFSSLFNEYLKRASSSQWDTSNPFASAIPHMDAALAEIADDEQAFAIVAAIVCGAEWKGNVPSSIVMSNFNAIPNLKAKAKIFGGAKLTEADACLKDLKVGTGLNVIVDEYLGDS